MSTMDIIAIVALALHILVVVLIIFWFVLGKPTSRAVFWQRFRYAFLGQHPKSPNTPR